MPPEAAEAKPFLQEWVIWLIGFAAATLTMWIFNRIHRWKMRRRTAKSDAISAALVAQQDEDAISDGVKARMQGVPRIPPPREPWPNYQKKWLQGWDSAPFYSRETL